MSAPPYLSTICFPETLRLLQQSASDIQSRLLVELARFYFGEAGYDDALTSIIISVHDFSNTIEISISDPTVFLLVHSTVTTGCRAQVVPRDDDNVWLIQHVFSLLHAFTSPIDVFDLYEGSLVVLDGSQRLRVEATGTHQLIGVSRVENPAKQK